MIEYSKKLVETCLFDLYVGNAQKKLIIFQILTPCSCEFRLSGTHTSKETWIFKENNKALMKNRGRIPFKYQENKMRSIALFERIILHENYVCRPMCGKIFDIPSMFLSEICIYQQNTNKNLYKKVGLMNVHFRPAEDTISHC